MSMEILRGHTPEEEKIDDHKMNRRKFLKKAAIAAGGIALGGCGISKFMEKPKFIGEEFNNEEKEENPEESKEKRIEVIQDIRNRYGILFLSCQPEGLNSKRRLPDDKEWMKDALGLPIDSEQLKTIRAIDQDLPDTVEESGIIIGGSISSVYDDSPWIRKLEEFIRAMHQKGKPMLGVCFGHQLIAQSMGGEVGKNPLGREFGNFNIDLTKEGADDPLFEDVPNRFTAAEAHGDIVTKLPELEKAAVLARNDMSEYQALGYGDNIRTVQFHPEITKPILEKISLSIKDKLIESGYIKDEEEFENFIENLKNTPDSRKILQNFNRNFIVKYHEKKYGK